MIHHIYNGQTDFSKHVQYKGSEQKISHILLNVTYLHLGEGREQRSNSSVFPIFQFIRWVTQPSLLKHPKCSPHMIS